jgi:hypothetical protein
LETAKENTTQEQNNMTQDTKYEQLQEFLKNYPLSDILCATSEQVFNEALTLRAAGYPETAAELEAMAEVLGCVRIPSVEVLR